MATASLNTTSSKRTTDKITVAMVGIRMLAIRRKSLMKTKGITLLGPLTKEDMPSHKWTIALKGNIHKVSMTTSHLTKVLRWDTVKTEEPNTERHT